MRDFTYDDDEVELAALCIYREARGEGYEGMRAVCHTICNRAEAMKAPAHVIHSVIMAKNQFTSMSVPSDPEFNLEPSGPLWFMAKDIAARVLAGDDEDPTDGALFYANLATATSGWFFENIVKSPLHPRTVTIKHHTFFR